MSMKASIILDLAGNLESQARRYEGALTGLARTGQRQFSVLDQATKAVGRTLDSLGNKYTAILTGAGTVGAVKMVMDIESRFTRLAIAANRTDEEVSKVKDRIYEVAQASDIRVDPTQLTAGFYKIIEKTGDWDYAIEQIRNIGLAMRATGVDGKIAGDLIAEFPKLHLKTSEDVAKALSTYIEQGRAGAFPLEDLATRGARIISQYSTTGRRGIEAIKDMGAALQIAFTGTGSPEVAGTAFESFLSELSTKSRQLSRAGIEVFEEANGRLRMRALTDVIPEIIAKANADPRKIKRVFGEQSYRQLSALISEYIDSGRIESLQKFYDVTADQSVLEQNANRGAKTADAALTSLSTAWKMQIDKKLTGPVKFAAEAVDALGSDLSGKIIGGAMVGGGMLGGLVLLRKLYLAGRSLGGLLGRGGKGAAGGILGGMGMPVPLPVYVVNSRMSMLPGAYGAGRAGGAAVAGASVAKSGGKWSRMLGGAGRFGGPLAVGLTALSLADTWTDSGSTTSDKIRDTGGGIGGIAGGLAGAKAGAAVGSLIAPGVGTLAGGGIGALLGWWGGEKAGTHFAEEIGQAVARALEEKSGRVEIEFRGGPGVQPVVRRLEGRGMDIDIATGLNMGY